MPVTPKPFDASEKIYKTVFKGKPNVYSAEDINRFNDAFLTDRDKAWEQVGPVRSGWSVSVLQTIDSYSAPNNQIEVEVKVVQPGVDSPYLYYKGIRFDVPTSLVTVYANIGSPFVKTAPTSPAAYLYLVAEIETVDFALDPVLSGINSTEFPTQLPAADNVVYKNERIELSDSLATVISGLNPNEEVICLLASIVEENRFTNVNNVKTESTTRVVRYNSTDITDIISAFPFLKGAGSTVYDSNESLKDALYSMKEHYLRTKSELDFYKVVVESREQIGTATLTNTTGSYYTMEIPTNKRIVNATVLNGSLVNQIHLNYAGGIKPPIGTIVHVRFTQTVASQLIIKNTPGTHGFVGLTVSMDPTIQADHVYSFYYNGVDGLGGDTWYVMAAPGYLSYRIEEVGTILDNFIATVYNKFLHNYAIDGSTQIMAENATTQVMSFIPSVTKNSTLLQIMFTATFVPIGWGGVVSCTATFKKNGVSFHTQIFGIRDGDALLTFVAINTSYLANQTITVEITTGAGMPAPGAHIKNRVIIAMALNAY